MVYRRGLDVLRSVGTSYTKSRLFVEEAPDWQYNRKRVPIGIDKSSGKVFTIDLTEGFRGLSIGKTGSGKTFLLRALADRLSLSDYGVMHLTDTKDEFKYSQRPVQSKFANMHLEGESPQGFPVIALRPTFFRDIRQLDFLPDDNEWFSVSPEELTKGDLKTLLNVSSETGSIQSAQEEFLHRLDEFLEEGVISWDYIEAVLESMKDDFPKSTVSALRRRWLPFRTSHFFSEDDRGSVVDMLIDDKIPAINFQGSEDFGSGNLTFAPVLVGILLRQVVAARRREKINRLCVFVDEAPRFIPADESFSCVKDFVESVERDRRYGVSFVFALQTLLVNGELTFPERIVKNCRYVFVPYNIDPDSFSWLLRKLGFKSSNDSIHAANRLLNRKRMNKFDQYVLDTSNKEITLIRPLAPLSRHAEASV